jgi:hypothetical protein
MFDGEGKRITIAKAAEMEMRSMHKPYRWRDGGLRNLYIEYVVDEDGCITVDPQDAVALLKRNGADIVFPRFKKSGLEEEAGKKRRLISNWFFREVPPDYTEDKPAPQGFDPEPEIDNTLAPEAPAKVRRTRKAKAVEASTEDIEG